MSAVALVVAMTVAAQTDPGAPVQSEPAVAVQTEPPAPSSRPRTYVLVAAVGDEIGIVSEGARTGTHMSQFRRTSADVPDNLLNRLVLNMMDAAVVKLDPESRRIYLTLAPGHLNGVDPMKREAAAIEKIVAALRPMPQRADWDRIVIVTPTFCTDLEGLPGKLQGPGCSSRTPVRGGWGSGLRLRLVQHRCAAAVGKPEATTRTAGHPRQLLRRAVLYMQLWVLNARTLEVIDHQKAFDSKKLYSRTWGPDRRSATNFSSPNSPE